MRLALLALVLCVAGPVTAQDEKGKELDQELKALRDGLIDAFNKSDVDALLKHVRADVVITWQNGEVVKGHDGFRAYHKKMMEGDKRIVASATAKPTVEGRVVAWSTDGKPTVVVSHGLMNDHFKLTDGMEFDLDSHWTATVVKDKDGWKVAGFHVGANVFENSVFKTAIKKTMYWTGGGGIVVGLLLGVLIGRFCFRKPTSPQASGTTS